MEKVLKFATMFSKATAWEDGEYRLDQEILKENPALRPGKTYEIDELGDYTNLRNRTDEEAIRQEALSLGRDPDLEIKAYRNRDYYYSRPGLAETRQGELNEEVKKTKKSPEEIVRQWAEKAGRDPEKELLLMKSKIIDPFGTRSFPREKFRALWTVLDIVDSEGNVRQPVRGASPPDVKGEIY